MFDASLWIEVGEPYLPSPDEPLAFVRSCSRRDYRAMRESVIRWLEEGRGWGLHAMAERLNSSYANLRYVLGPELSSRVVEAGNAARLAETAARRRERYGL